MSIFDKILGKEEKVEKPQPEADQPLTEASKPVEKKTTDVVGEKKPAKAEKAKEKSAKKTKVAKPVKTKKEVAKRKVSKKDENIAHRVLLENLISEKSTLLAAQNKYVFKVTKDSGKFQIKEAIEGYYGVQVVSVNTIKINPKKRIHGRTIGWKKGFKKAIVTLREGDSIAAVEGV
jgi:large subunit ribosomal protein L23